MGFARQFPKKSEAGYSQNACEPFTFKCTTFYYYAYSQKKSVKWSKNNDADDDDDDDDNIL